MAEIKQTLGFNASQAIDTLNSLEASMRAFKNATSSTTKVLGAFNEKADKTSGVLKRLASDSEAAFNQLAKLSSIQGKAIAPTIGGKVTSATQDISKYTTALQKLSPLTKKSTGAQIRAWQSLATKTAEVAARNGMSVREMISINSKLGQSLTGPANTIANNMQKMSNAAQDTAKKWTISWETMARVVVTQTIVRTLNIIRQSLKAAIGNAVKFQRAVAEIGTIAPKLGGLENIEDMVRGVSDAFNIGLSDTAEAAYQTISNQIAETQKNVESFLGSAAKFSKITKTDMATAVNLLSGTLNAFGKSISETDDVAAKFFKTIELGRTRAEELALGYGTVAPIADKLGIQMEELNAAIATLTISGIQTDKAFTQIRGTMQGFLKPTTEMKAAMKGLGFATGEQILQAYNLQEAIIAVTKTTGGNAAAIAKLFPRIRGLTGVLGLASDVNEHFTKTLKEQETALEDTYDKAYRLIIVTEAEKVTKELNKLKNFFTDDFGQAFLEGANQIISMGVNADVLVSILKSMATILPLVGVGAIIAGGGMAHAAINAYKLSAAGQAAATSMTRLQAAMGVFAIAAGALMAIDAFRRYQEAALNAQVDSARAANDVEVLNRQKALDKQVLAEKKRYNQIEKFTAQHLAKYRKAYMEEISITERSSAAVVSSTTWALDGIVKSRLAAVEAIKGAAKEADEALRKSQQTAADMKTVLGEKLFQRNLDETESDAGKMRKILARSVEESERAVRLMGSATTKQEHDIAMAAHSRALALNDQAYALAQSSDSTRNRSKINRLVENQTQDMIKAEQTFGGRLQKTSKDLKVSARDAAAWAAAMQESQEKIEQLSKTTDAEGPLTQEQLVKNREKVEKELENFFKIVDQGVERFGADASPIVQKLVEGLAISEAELEVQTLLALPTNLVQIQEDVKSSFDTFWQQNPARVKIEFYADLMGLGEIKDMQTAESLTVAQAEHQKKLIGLQREAATSLNVQKGHQQDMLKIMQSMEKLPETTMIAGLDGEMIELPNEAAISLNKLRDTYLSVGKAGIQTGKEFEALIGQSNLTVAGLSQGWHGIGGEVKKYADEIKLFEKAMQDLGEAQGEFQRSTKNIMSQNADQSRKDVQQAKSAMKAYAWTDRGTGNKLIQSKLLESATAKQAQSEQQVTAAVKETSSVVEGIAQKYLVSAAATREAKEAQKGLTQEAVKFGSTRMQNPLIKTKEAAQEVKPVLATILTGQQGITAEQNNTTAAIDVSIFKMKLIEGSLQRQIGLQSQLQQNISGAVINPVTQSKGGQVGYFANGGRGTDTIPAMLSAGEHVTNARSSRRFFSQLQAMNAGQQPVFRNDGGDTYNTSVGDINVSGAGKPAVVAREVMKAIRREERRGSSR